jgi:heme exporter protein D
MDGLASFVDMGGYGAYVWPAFGVTVLVLVVLLLTSLRGLHAQEATLQALQRQEDEAGGGRRTRRRARA